jgi:hypothetical protein
MKPIALGAQAVLELLIDGLEGENTHRKIDNAAGTYMAVSVERVGARRWSVAHYYEQHGDLMRDPEVVFWQGADDRFYPCEWTQDGMPGSYAYQLLIEFDDTGKPTRIAAKRQRDCATFCSTWMANIKAQQELKKTKPPREQLEALVWKHSHADFKGVTDGVRYRLHLNEKTGGTESWPLSTFTDEQLIEKLPSKVRESDAGRAVIAALKGPAAT